MALDPNIILQAGRGVTPIQTFDPTEVQAKQIGLAQAMQNMQDAQQFRQTYGMSPGLAKQIQEMTSAQATAQKSAIDQIGRAHV